VRRLHAARSAATGAPGHLRVIVQPWAEVSVDGKPAGMTPAPPVLLPAGPHVVSLKNDELGRLIRRKIIVPPGGEAVLRVDLFHP
jgi:serine/threonine-protein kinase